jgi:hypothetical protein
MTHVNMEKESDMETEFPSIAQHDIYSVAYCAYKGIMVTLTKQDRRVIFNLPDTLDTYKALSEFNNNPELPLLDYITHLKRLRAMMINLRG